MGLRFLQNAGEALDVLFCQYLQLDRACKVDCMSCELLMYIAMHLVTIPLRKKMLVVTGPN